MGSNGLVCRLRVPVNLDRNLTSKNLTGLANTHSNSGISICRVAAHLQIKYEASQNLLCLSYIHNAPRIILH